MPRRRCHGERDTAAAPRGGMARRRVAAILRGGRSAAAALRQCAGRRPGPHCRPNVPSPPAARRHPLTHVDWIILGFTCSRALRLSQGFVVGALSLVGFAVGAFAGDAAGPAGPAGGNESPYAPLFGLIGALVAGGIIAAGLEGLGSAVRRRMRWRGLRTADAIAGALLTRAWRSWWPGSPAR